MLKNHSKIRRSALYMPCSNQRALEKAATLAADVLLFDLEDAVAPDKKDLARTQIVQALASLDYGYREKIVRINALNSLWGQEDIKALQDSDFDGLLLPKAETVEQINQALAQLGKTVPIWLMIETPQGVLNVEQLAQHPAVRVLLMGTNDLAKELKVAQSSSRAEFAYTFGRVIMAARAYQRDVLDGVYNQLDNEQGLHDVCMQGKLLGFDGKTLIHPKQLACVNQIFSPHEEEVNHAEKIVSAWEDAENKGVIVVDGKLVEALHVEQAQQLLIKTQQIQVQEESHEKN